MRVRLANPMTPSPTLIFVGGLHRSGTSLLTQCIAAHPDVAFMGSTGAPEDEGQHLQTVYRSEAFHGGPGRFAFDPDAHMTEDAELVSELTAVRLVTQWAQHWDTTRPFAVEKSPPNILKARFLQALFPNARFVFIVRHPISVAFATNRWAARPLRPLNLPTLFEHWTRAHRLMLSDLPHLRRVRIVRYEALVAESTATLRDVYQYLEIPGHPLDLGRALERAPAIRGDASSAYLRQWSRKWSLYTFPSRVVGGLSRDWSKVSSAFGYSLARPATIHAPTDPIVAEALCPSDPWLV